MQLFHFNEFLRWTVNEHWVIFMYLLLGWDGTIEEVVPSGGGCYWVWNEWARSTQEFCSCLGTTSVGIL